MGSDSVRQLFPQLLQNGYTPLPNRDKTCMLPKWSTINVDITIAKRWTRQTRWPAIGLRVEPPLLVLDYDLPSVEIAAAFRHIVPAAALAGLERVGNPPKTAFFLRLSEDDEPFRKLTTRRYLLDKKTFQVEAFGGGGGAAQFGAFGPHSHDEQGNVLKTYSWVGDRSPANVALHELPELSRRQVAQAIDRAEEMLAAWPGLTVDPLSTSGAEQEPDEYDLTAQMVFTDVEGSDYSLEELIAEAKARYELQQPQLRITGSFTGDPTSTGSPRCKVAWGPHKGLSVHDFKTCITHRPEIIEGPEIQQLLGSLRRTAR
jgi:hypothetical protein